jgi:hypothetical protein
LCIICRSFDQSSQVFSGAGSDIPLDIANDRAAHHPMHPNASAAQRQRFAQFVHGKVKEAVPDIPDFGKEWARCNLAGQMLDQHLAQEAVMNFMEDQKWSLTHGGFRVPRGEFRFIPLSFSDNVSRFDRISWNQIQEGILPREGSQSQDVEYR